MSGMRLGELSMSTLEGLLSAANEKVKGLLMEKSQAEQEVASWMSKFVADNGRSPTEQEKEEQGAEVYNRCKVVYGNIKKNDDKISSLEKQIAEKRNQLSTTVL